MPKVENYPAKSYRRTMGVTAAIIAGATSLIGTGISVLGASGRPSYPSLPKMYKLPVAKAKKHMEQYEKERMAASGVLGKINFPCLPRAEKPR